MSKESREDETERLEKDTLNRLLSTPPQPKTKPKLNLTAKKRGRPPKSQACGENVIAESSGSDSTDRK